MQVARLQCARPTPRRLATAVIEAVGLRRRAAHRGPPGAVDDRRPIPARGARRQRLRGRRAAAAAGRASAFRARGRALRQPARRAASRRPSAIWPAPIRRRASSRSARSRRCSRASSQPAIFCAAPHGAAAALIDSLLTESPPQAAGMPPRVVDISADYRFASAEAYEAVYQHAHGAPRAPGAVHLRAARAPAASAAPRTSRIRAALRPRCCWPSCRCWRSGCIEPAAVRRGDHRQHRLGPQARRGHAPSRCATAICTPTTRWRIATRPKITRLRAGRHRASTRRLRLRAALRPVRPRHPCHRAGATAAAARHRRRCSPRCASSMPARPSCTCAIPRRASRTSPPAITRSSRRGQRRPHRRGDVRARQSQQGRRRRRRQWMNRLFDLPETAGLTAPAPGWT